MDDEHIVSETIDEDDTNRGKPGENEKWKSFKILEMESIHGSNWQWIIYPSNHKNGRTPVFDTEQWIEQVDVNGELKEQIMHSHYTNEMTSKYVIHVIQPFQMKL